MLAIYYQACRCSIWPLIHGVQVNRCGRCRQHPDGIKFGNYHDALVVFRATNGKDPIQTIPEGYHES